MHTQGTQFMRAVFRGVVTCRIFLAVLSLRILRSVAMSSSTDAMRGLRRRHFSRLFSVSSLKSTSKRRWLVSITEISKQAS